MLPVAHYIILLLIVLYIIAPSFRSLAVTRSLFHSYFHQGIMTRLFFHVPKLSFIMKLVYKKFLPVLLTVGILASNNIQIGRTDLSHLDSIKVIFHARDYPSRHLDRYDPAPHGSVTSKSTQSYLKRIDILEYNVSYDTKRHKYQSPNRRHNIRAYYEPGKFTVNSRLAKTKDASLQLITEGIFADNKLLYTPSKKGKIETTANKIEIYHDGYYEQFINDEKGTRQNFVIETAPKNVDKIEVSLLAKGMKVKDLGENVLAFHSGSENQWIYRDIRCWDHNERQLNGSISIRNGKIILGVDVKDANFPITIDPLISNGDPSNADEVMNGSQSDSGYGASVSGAGDVNNDGFDDVIVGAPYYDLSQPNEGAAFLFYGSLNGIDAGSPVILQIGQQGANFGTSVANAGDLNNDGFDDVVVGAPYFDNEDTDEGAAFVFLGQDTGISQTPQNHVEGNLAGANMGYAVACAGRVNNDAYTDIIIAAPGWQNTEIGEGAAFVFHGSQQGLDPLIKTSLEGNIVDAHISSVTGAGDVNNDGYDDVVLGALGYTNGQFFEGAAFVYYGSPAGISPNEKTILEGGQEFPAMGVSIAGPGDVNGDGFDDIIVGASEYSHGQSHEGVVFVFYGSAMGISLSSSAILEKNQAEADFGHSVSGVGDLNSDGYVDVAVGAYRFDNGQEEEGATFIFFGSQDGLKPSNLMYESNQSFAHMGQSVASAGDVDGDGVKDLIIGAQTFGKNSEGAAFVFQDWQSAFPVTLINFEGKALEHEIELRWSTSEETNSDRFEIQRRNSSSKEWIPIGVIPSHENAVIRNNYSFRDVAPLHGQNLYRLRMIDKDESYSLSRIQNVDFTHPESHMIKLYPNPALEKLTLESESLESFSIIDSNGKQVYRMNGPKVYKEIDINFLPAGTYVVVLQLIDGSINTRKIVVK